MQALNSVVTLTYHSHLVDSGVILVRIKNPQKEIVFLCFYVLYFLFLVMRLEYFHADVGVA